MLPLSRPCLEPSRSPKHCGYRGLAATLIPPMETPAAAMTQFLPCSAEGGAGPCSLGPLDPRQRQQRHDLQQPAPRLLLSFMDPSAAENKLKPTQNEIVGPVPPCSCRLLSEPGIFQMSGGALRGREEPRLRGLQRIAAWGGLSREEWVLGGRGRAPCSCHCHHCGGGGWLWCFCTRGAGYESKGEGSQLHLSVSVVEAIEEEEEKKQERRRANRNSCCSEPRLFCFLLFF